MKKTAVITGGSRGIGFACAKQLGKDGFNVVIVDVNDPDDYTENLQKLEFEKIDYLYVRADICSAEDRERVVAESVAKFGGIHALVNAAGVGAVRCEMLDVTEEEYDRVLNVNAKGLMFFTNVVAKQMLKQPVIGNKRGSIVNISSINATANCPGLAVYGISKAAVSMMTTLFAERLAGEAIFVNEVRPFMIATDMALKAKAKFDRMIENGEIPIPRWGRPEDVASVVSAYCDEDKFNFSTGNFVYVDGGYMNPRMK